MGKLAAVLVSKFWNLGCCCCGCCCCWAGCRARGRARTGGRANTLLIGESMPLLILLNSTKIKNFLTLKIITENSIYRVTRHLGNNLLLTWIWDVLPSCFGS